MTLHVIVARPRKSHVNNMCFDGNLATEIQSTLSFSRYTKNKAQYELQHLPILRFLCGVNFVITDSGNHIVWP